jgi:putative ABC transport system permease protein
MRTLRALALRFASLWNRNHRDNDFADELAGHIDIATEDNLRSGMTPAEARRKALVELGGLESIKESYRDRRGVPWLEHIAQDLRYTLRQMKHSPGFVIVAVITLAVGIGSTTGVFTVANAVLLRAMPYPEPDRLMLIWGDDAGGRDQRDQVSFTDIEDVRTRNRVFTAVSNFAHWQPTLAQSGLPPERLNATQVGDEFFKVIRVTPALGRTFTPEEQIDGKDRVIILSHQLWKNRFGADPAVLGSTIRLSSQPYLVVGVMPPSFESLPSTLVKGGDLYRPIAEPYDDTQRDAHHLRAIARLRSGVTLAQAQQDVDRVAQQLQSEHPREDHSLKYRLTHLEEDTVSGYRPSLLLLLGAVATLLLVSCVNIAALLLARGSARRKEMAVRAALGASASRLLLQALTESMLLSSLGAALGMALAFLARNMARSLAPNMGSPLAHASIDYRVLLFTALVTVITAVLFGAAPALQSLKIKVVDTLKQGGQVSGIGRSQKKLHGALIIIELALAVVLLSVGGLLMRSFVRVQQVDLGFQPEQRLSINVWPPYAQYRSPEKQRAFFHELLRRVEAIPGVYSAAVVQNAPLHSFDGRAVLPEGREDRPENVLSPEAYFVTPKYLQVMGTPLLRGRAFTDSDDDHSQQVAIISEQLAAQIWPGQDSIGKRLQFHSDKKVDGKYPFRTIVGVVADIRHNGPELPAKPSIYLPFDQFPVPFLTLVVHSATPQAIVPAIRRELAGIDADIALFDIGTMSDFMARTTLLRRLSMSLVVAFGLLALFQAAVGLYGLISYLVAQTQRELGVRAALGASPKNLLMLVGRFAFRLLLAGSVVGLVIAVIINRVIVSMLFETLPLDLVTILASVAVLALVGLLASYLPARRAAYADPSLVLRGE